MPDQRPAFAPIHSVSDRNHGFQLVDLFLTFFDDVDGGARRGQLIALEPILVIAGPSLPQHGRGPVVQRVVLAVSPLRQVREREGLGLRWDRLLRRHVVGRVRKEVERILSGDVGGVEREAAAFVEMCLADVGGDTEHGMSEARRHAALGQTKMSVCVVEVILVRHPCTGNRWQGTGWPPREITVGSVPALGQTRAKSGINVSQFPDAALLFRAKEQRQEQQTSRECHIDRQAHQDV